MERKFQQFGVWAPSKIYDINITEMYRSYEYNSTSLVLVHHMILEIRLFFLPSSSFLVVACILQLGLDEGKEQQLYLENHAMYMFQTCTVMLTRTCTFQRY